LCFSIDLTVVGKGCEDITSPLSAGFVEFLEAFHGQGKVADGLPDALPSVYVLIQAAVAVASWLAIN
jgi:hypothetical protein